jgi:hypothetical protein
MGNLQNLNSNGSANERTKRKKHKCDFKTHIATIEFHSNIIKLFGNGEFPSIVKLLDKKLLATSCKRTLSTSMMIPPPFPSIYLS